MKIYLTEYQKGFLDGVKCAREEIIEEFEKLKEPLKSASNELKNFNLELSEK